MDGDMTRCSLTLLLIWFLSSGCAGRVDTDLLHARIREQTTELTEAQREIVKTRAELQRSRQEAKRLKGELNQAGHSNVSETVALSTVQIKKLHIHSLACGGVNKNDQPGDDAVVVQFVPIDSDDEPIKFPGIVEITLLDPILSDADRILGRWTFSADECRSRWTRGISGSGFQFSLPLEQTPEHSDVVVHVRFKTADNRQFDVSQ